MREQPKLAAPDHGWGEVHHERVGLKVQVAQHFIGAPAANKLDDVGINLSAEQCHGASRAKSASGDVFGLEVQVGRAAAALRKVAVSTVEVT